MQEDLRYAKIKEALNMARTIKDSLSDIVWEPQEGGRVEQFDTLPKAEQIAIVGIFSDASNLVQSLAQFDHWFMNE